MKLTPAEAQALAAAQVRDATLDGARKRSEGIVHTPPELSRFVAQAVDDVLREQLGVLGGVADERVALIDPAAGPGAFIAAAHAVAGARSTQPGAVIALERDARGSAALDLAWNVDTRHVDTLIDVQPHSLASAAPVLAVLGNPPWVGAAQDKPVPWLDALLDELKRDAQGERLQERKIGVLADAYVRFLAWTLGVARRAEQGAVVGLVTNGSYLDGPVHRGLRAALMRSFDALWIVDLGGNALLARDGAADGNVFGVRTSVAVLIAVRGARTGEQPHARVSYVRMDGPARGKLDELATATLGSLPFRILQCADPAYRFAPGPAAPPEYLASPSLAELMPFHREGVQTNRDAVVVDTDRERLVMRLRAFAAGEPLEALAEAERALPHYDPQTARVAVRAALADADARAYALPLAYRPFDARWFAPIAPLCHRPRAELIAAMQRSAFALVTVRKDRGSVPWRHAAAVAHVLDNCFLSTRSSCRARAFPTHTADGKPNVEPALLAQFEARADRTLTVEELATYALAWLASPDYQAKHEAWLRVDYPRVPLPASAEEFALVLALGAQLRSLFCTPFDVGAAAQQEMAGAADVIVGHHRVLDRFTKGRRDVAGASIEAGHLRVRLAALRHLLTPAAE